MKGHLRKGIIMLKCWRIIILLISPSLRTVTKILEYSGTALIQFTHSVEIKREIPFSPLVFIGGSRGACPAHAPHLPGILVHWRI